jgi:hypothetical protein
MLLFLMNLAMLSEEDEPAEITTPRRRTVFIHTRRFRR